MEWKVSRKQFNFFFYLFVSSSLFFWDVVIKLFDYFSKSISLFSKLCDNCLLMYYFVYCINCALKIVNGACWCTCSLVALSAPQTYFWPAKTRKKLEILEMQTCLWPGAQIWFRHKGRKLVTASLLLHCIDGYSCLRYWIEFVSAVVWSLD